MPATAELRFEHPRSWGRRFALAAPILVGGGGAVVLLALLEPSWLSLVLLPLGVIGIVNILGRIVFLASRVDVSGDGISATTYARRTTRMRWEDVARVERHEHWYVDLGRTVVVRLVGRRGGSILFTSKIDQFDELLTLVRDTAAAAQHAPLARAWRLLAS